MWALTQHEMRPDTVRVRMECVYDLHHILRVARRAIFPGHSVCADGKRARMPLLKCAHCGHPLTLENDQRFPDHRTRADHIHITHDVDSPSYSLLCQCRHYTINIVGQRPSEV